MVDSVLAERPAHVPTEVIVDFDIYNPPGMQDNGFHAAWKTLQQPGVPDLVWTPRNGGHWIATRGTLITEVFNSPETFSSRIMQVPRSRNEGNHPIPGSIDSPLHAKYRAMINPHLAPKAVSAMVDGIRALTVELIEGFKPKGRCDFLTEFALELPLRIFLGYANLPVEDLPKLRALAEEKNRPVNMTAADVMRELHAYLEPIVAARIGSNGEDLISKVLSGTVDGAYVSIDEGVRFCSQIVVAGLDTVASLLSFTFHMLAQRPDLRATLATQPEIVPAATDEFIRRFPLVAIARELDGEFEHDGVTLRPGDVIVLPTMLHGLDERYVEDPMTIDFMRSQILNSTFGGGPHRCPGSALGRTEVRIVLEEWFQRIPDFTLLHPERVGYRSGVAGTITNLELRW